MPSTAEQPGQRGVETGVGEDERHPGSERVGKVGHHELVDVMDDVLPRRERIAARQVGGCGRRRGLGRRASSGS